MERKACVTTRAGSRRYPIGTELIGTNQTYFRLWAPKAKHVDLAGMLRTLRAEYKVRTVACEGGPTLFRALLERGFVDQLNLTIAPYLFGGAGAPTLTGLSKRFLPASVHCTLTGMRVIGDECFLTYRIKPKAKL